METGLNKKEQLALEKFKIVLQKELKDELLEVILFGSKARGDARKDSDIDVLIIISSDDWHKSDIVHSIVIDILLEDEILISPKTISNKHYNYLCNIKAPFIKNVIREGIQI